MSVNDPLLKDLKGSVLGLIENINGNCFILDSNVGLIEFCILIEKVFSYGLNAQGNFVFTRQTEAWSWLESSVNNDNDIASFKYSSAVKFVKQEECLSTNKGRLRALIRYCLNDGCLYVPVKHFVRDSKSKAIIYKQNSILGDEILSEIFLSVLLQVSKIKFKLDASNTSFLDYTWDLPEVLKLELVPCKSLGISVSFVQEKALIVHIQSSSVLAENANVCVGDVLDSLNGVHICSSVKGKLNSIVRNSRGQPVLVKIVKVRNSKTNDLFSPIVALMKQLKLDPGISFNSSQDKGSGRKNKNSTGFSAKYVGSSYIGMLGNTRQIDIAYKNLLSPFRQSETDKERKIVKKFVNIEIGELGVKVYDCETSQVILQHSFMEISACGSVTLMPNYFAYIVGDGYCDVATDFTCHIFYSKDIDLVFTLLQSIGQGFRRTHYAV
ncbi:uncharacterized protein LOC108741176 isoform X2 [Agrilus planipennis]|uniref:Uncharacterized protein LOC108741176 isoform X2 n=1 Tax=Agrilus planipennis TaxID=224129 RepID=A0A1W4XGA4_AGRPL|nr:uncharacterized protein LOC108741176 isoform X2 [Agrilus planipennis]